MFFKRMKEKVVVLFYKRLRSYFVNSFFGAYRTKQLLVPSYVSKTFYHFLDHQGVPLYRRRSDAKKKIYHHRNSDNILYNALRSIYCINEKVLISSY